MEIRIVGSHRGIGKLEEKKPMWEIIISCLVMFRDVEMKLVA